MRNILAKHPNSSIRGLDVSFRFVSFSFRFVSGSFVFVFVSVRFVFVLFRFVFVSFRFGSLRFVSWSFVFVSFSFRFRICVCDLPACQLVLRSGFASLFWDYGSPPCLNLGRDGLARFLGTPSRDFELVCLMRCWVCQFYLRSGFASFAWVLRTPFCVETCNLVLLFESVTLIFNLRLTCICTKHDTIVNADYL